METQIGIILSIFSATATALWTAWTWIEQHEEEMEQKRNQIAALYVNPFLLSAEELRGRLYGILNGQQLEFFKKEYPEKLELGSPEALELLYVMVKYFGWYSYICRYGPYTRDKKAIELIIKIVITFANDQDFEGDAFYFSLSEQISLGQTFVKSFGRADLTYPQLKAVSLYKFAEEIRDDIEKDRPLYQNLIKTIEAIDRADSIEELEGRDRLIVIHNQLIDLLNYIEGEEGFSISPIDRNKIQFKGSTSDDIEIIHSIPGRVRLRINCLREDESYAEKLRQRLESLADVQAVSINSSAASVVINYTPAISEAIFQQRIFQAIGS